MISADLGRPGRTSQPAPGNGARAGPPALRRQLSPAGCLDNGTLPVGPPLQKFHLRGPRGSPVLRKSTNDAPPLSAGPRLAGASTGGGAGSAGFMRKVGIGTRRVSFERSSGNPRIGVAKELLEPEPHALVVSGAE